MVRLDSEHHEYRDAAGVVIPHVTAVLQAAGVIDYSWMPDREWHMTRGKAIHRACDLLARGLLDEASVDPRIQGYVAAFGRFMSESGCRVLETERLCYHRAYGYSGMADVLTIIGDRPWVLDAKTTAVPPSAGPQTAAYMQALNTELETKIEKRGGLALRKDGTYRLVEFTGEDDWLDFVAALRLYKRWKREK
ncbi:MAG: hypothetical protein QME74_01530 [Candidatus Edwardsbacteria bacterium]|nr:hypothetical protein [Candidatus Edwardsbacteria bacterium]